MVSDSIIGEAGLEAGSIPAQIGNQSLLLGGDLILEINGLICATPHDFQLVRTSTLALDGANSYSITVFRDGEVIDLIAGTEPEGTIMTLSHK